MINENSGISFRIRVSVCELRNEKSASSDFVKLTVLSALHEQISILSVNAVLQRQQNHTSGACSRTNHHTAYRRWVQC